MLLAMQQAVIEVCCSLYWAGRAASAGRPSTRRDVYTMLVQAALAQETALHGEWHSLSESGNMQFGQPENKKMTDRILAVSPMSELTEGLSEALLGLLVFSEEAMPTAARA